MSALQSTIASAWGVLEVSVLGDITDETLAGLQVEVVVDAIDGARVDNVARKAILQASVPPA